MSSHALLPWSLVGSGGRERACDLGGLATTVQHQVFENMNDLAKPVRHKLLISIREIIKEAAVADPDMEKPIQEYIKRCINLFWGDLMVFVDMSAEDAMEQHFKGREHKHLASLGDVPSPCSPIWWRSLFLYSILPFDKSIFGQLKDPFFWVHTAFSMVSLYGIRVSYYSVLLFFILMQNPDEFQIVQFIIMLKGTFFLSGGVVQGVRACWGYLHCVHPGGCHTCDRNGPAYTLDTTTQAVDLLGTFTLVWVAYISLRWSVHHGWHKVSAKDTEIARKASHGGHLHHLMMYDLLCLSVSTALFWYLAFEDAGILWVHQQAVAAPGPLCAGGTLSGPSVTAALAPPRSASDPLHHLDTWDFHRAFLFGRMFYALLSTPFVIFRLPGLNTILTHTTMTGYNKQGRCVTFCLPPVK